MEPIILWFTKVIASVSVGHYTKHLLERFDREIASMIERKSDPKEISEAIVHRNLGKEFTEVYKESLLNIEVIPVKIDLTSATLDKLSAIEEVLAVGLSVARAIGAHAIFPGCILGDSFVTVFHPNESGHDLSINNNRVDTSAVQIGLVEMPSASAAKEICGIYVRSVRDLLLDGNPARQAMNDLPTIFQLQADFDNRLSSVEDPWIGGRTPNSRLDQAEQPPNTPIHTRG